MSILGKVLQSILAAKILSDIKKDKEFMRKLENDEERLEKLRQEFEDTINKIRAEYGAKPVKKKFKK